ncbi:glycine betaine ABC transporter substrate-binding protein [Pontibacterium granulatum]|uniref:glycine betaine ABC transporter substrate-binding protein n=1 Tax=Pontibacterium granulatum TaxID=2036029 RepID=UPI00249C24ED|nr:glycine betaine ABC transporter substrate-binding protein [Pontibacterium granulatum]MDI3326440.1 glycine betaine ABC transporter substrate-binding protein [Pontibacterium granulatum]
MKRITKLAATSLISMAMALPVKATELVIGGKNFTEQQLLTEITSQYLSKNGYDIERKAGMGSSVLRKAQENGQIDLYWEYTGTSLLNYNKVKEKVPASEVYSRVKELDAKRGLVWLNASKANNTYALAMRRSDADDRGISTLTDLAKAVNTGGGLTLAVNAEFYARKDGLKPLQKAYDFKFPRSDIKRMDTGLTYTALKESQVDVALVFATDGRIPAFDFLVLKDDKNYFPEYAITPVVREEALKANPKLAEQMNKLSALIDNYHMSDLNARVDVQRQSIEQVASDFLEENGL